jgi:hypothetical protein
MNERDLPSEGSSEFPIPPFVGKCFIVAAWLLVLATLAFVIFSAVLVRAPT